MEHRLLGSAAEHVASASAAKLWNSLPELMKLSAVEGFERLEDYFINAFLNCFEKLIRYRVPEPSKN